MVQAWCRRPVTGTLWRGCPEYQILGPDEALDDPDVEERGWTSPMPQDGAMVQIDSGATRSRYRYHPAGSPSAFHAQMCEQRVADLLGTLRAGALAPGSGTARWRRVLAVPGRGVSTMGAAVVGTDPLPSWLDDSEADRSAPRARTAGPWIWPTSPPRPPGG